MTNEIVTLKSKKKLNENEEFCLFCDTNDLYAELRAYFYLDEYLGKEYKEYYDSVDLRPKTYFDHIKHAITSFCPDLTFGWLIPDYELVLLQTTIVYKDVYRIDPLTFEEMNELDCSEECICEH